MTTLKEIINYIVLLCDVGAGARILYCFLQIHSNPDEEKSYLKKIRNVVIFLILANSALALKELITRYF
ncbi:hypothetical protein [Anaeromicropila herbilytica]|uniref:Mercury transporter n=1 Tax=Anaeromicropila herbilytica TaxID=2785025 RepID=A0A7R7IBE9_9FIRM|nr:hypothetical protein [Anaeromicropila herbilytica]BCN29527.1 hypothetical protein bsdtb5_08220 [Anaeromicropila herbilytica]